MLCFVCVSSRLNALRLEEKEKKEKEMVQEIIEAAEQYKAEFYSKRSITIENNRKTNREKEKVICLSVNLCFKHSRFLFELCDELSTLFD